MVVGSCSVQMYVRDGRRMDPLRGWEEKEGEKVREYQMRVHATVQWSIEYPLKYKSVYTILCINIHADEHTHIRPRSWLVTSHYFKFFPSSSLLFLQIQLVCVCMCVWVCWGQGGRQGFCLWTALTVTWGFACKIATEARSSMHPLPLLCMLSTYHTLSSPVTSGPPSPLSPAMIPCECMYETECPSR